MIEGDGDAGIAAARGERGGDHARVVRDEDVSGREEGG